MNDEEPQDFFLIITFIIIIIYTDKLHAAALDSSFHLPNRSSLMWTFSYKSGSWPADVYCYPSVNAYFTQDFPLEHSCLGLFINSDHHGRSLKKTERQTFMTRG